MQNRHAIHLSKILFLLFLGILCFPLKAQIGEILLPTDLSPDYPMGVETAPELIQPDSQGFSDYLPVQLTETKVKRASNINVSLDFDS